MLTNNQINQNYRSALALSAELLQTKFRSRGYEPFDKQELLQNLAQSALADEQIVDLLKTTAFKREIYLSVINKALDQVKKEIFLDVNKHRFVSFEQVKNFISHPRNTQTNNGSGYKRTKTRYKFSALLEKRLSPDSYSYLQRFILNRSENRKLFIGRLLNKKIHFTKNEWAEIEAKIQVFQKLFPDGSIPGDTITDGHRPLEDRQILTCYKKVLCGIERFYPANFLKYEGKRRAAVIIRFLLNDFLNTDSQKFLNEKDGTFFIQYKIQNIYRLFNYSMNRALYNAFPEFIKPWMSSRIPDNYWEDENNRINAIRWLVEDKLGLYPQQFKKPVLSRKAFAEHGLSYMFARYYNSVSKALKSAYPELEPWEVGNVPKSYWTEANAAKAVRRMLEKNNWNADQLPRLYKSGVLNRQTFSEAGLATVFELRYAKNIYRAVSAAFPGQFEQWEFGNVPSGYWMNRKNVFYASSWIARQEGIENSQITSAIRTGKLNFDLLKKYSIGSVLKRFSGNSLFKLYIPFFRKEHIEAQEDRVIDKRIKKFIHREIGHPMISFLLYGLFGHLVQQSSKNYLSHLERLQQRRYRNRNL